MSIDLKAAILSAFQNLDAFSVPGVGTFRRIFQEAKVDHEKKLFAPPSEEFILESGELQVQNLEDFFFRHLKVNVRKAKDLVNATADWFRQETAEGKSILFPGIGKVVAPSENDYQLHKPAGLSGQAGAFFGLGTIAFNLNERKVPLRDKEEVINTALNAAGAPAEPAPPPERGMRVWPILLILLVLGLGVGGFVFRDEVRSWFSSSSSSLAVGPDTDGPDGKHGKNGTAIIDGDSSDTKNQLATNDKGNNGSKETLDKTPENLPPKPDNKVNKTPKETNTTNNFPSEKKNIDVGAIRPVAGQFYLVVASATDAYVAQSIANQNKGSFIVAPPGGWGYYKVCVFRSSDKGAVIQKMVQLKNVYTDSWIYYLGM